jgi:anthranilate synthase component 1
LKLDGKDLEKNYFKATDKLNSLSFLILNNTTFKEEEKIFQNQKTTDFKPNIMRNDYISMVKQAKDHILKGELIQCVLSQRFLLEKKFQDINEEFKFNDLKFIKLYSYLVEKNPSDYMYYFNFGNNFQIIGSSPEMFLKVRGNKVIIRPVAGTTSIDKNKDFSEKLFHLKNSEKDNAEHIMLVDLARNDLGRVCKTGSVKVSKLMNIETYSHVAHIVSEIEGIIRPEFDCFDAFIASFPTGTLVGAPKIRAAQLISELEPEGRGPYCGAIGWFDIRGNIDTGTIIRSVIIKDEKISYNGGGGIVFDSDPELEYQETLDKTKIFNEYIE